MMRLCPRCKGTMREDCFRKGAKTCVWCAYESMEKRAKARYRDKRKLAEARLHIGIEEFVSWYVRQDDCCAYCGLTFSELRRLRIKRRGGYSVAWDIDRIDSSRPYEEGNLALSCFVCNMAKGDTLSYAEARVVGQTIRSIWDARLVGGER